jgi:anti-sigma factor (TIGR02949 family)
MSKDKARDIDCREALKLVDAYVDKQAAGDDAHALEKHLESCRHCFDRVEFEQLFKKRLQGLKVDVSSKNLSPKVRQILEDL